MGYPVGGVPLVVDIDLDILTGRRCLVLGANRSGKSLRLRLCHGLFQPSSGAGRWRNGEARPAAKAMVLQRPVRLRRSITANLDDPLALRDLARIEPHRTVAETLERFGLAPLGDRPATRSIAATIEGWSLDGIAIVDTSHDRCHGKPLTSPLAAPRRRGALA